jgi:thioredoxin 1
MEYRFTEKNFEQEVLKSDIPVVIDFYAEWCGPCRAMGPVVAELADAYDGKVKVGKVNSDEQQALAQRFNVMSIPSFFVIKDGKVVDSAVGGMPKGRLEQKIKALL